MVLIRLQHDTQEEFALLELQGGLECTDASVFTRARLPPDDGEEGGGSTQKRQRAVTTMSMSQQGNDMKQGKAIQGNGQLNGVVLAKVLSTDSQGNPTLVIGGHKLTGHMETLAKPQIIVQRQTNQSQQGGEEEEDDVDMEKNATSSNLVIKGVVRKKVVFTTRPQPLIGKTSCTEFYNKHAKMVEATEETS